MTQAQKKIKMSDKAAAEFMVSAMRSSNLSALHALLFTDGANPDLYYNGKPMLSFAASLEMDKAVSMLLEAGANVHNVDNEGFTPLRRAILVGDVVSVKKLIEAGADPTAGVYIVERGIDLSDADFSRERGVEIASAVFRVVDRFEVNRWVREDNYKALKNLLEDETPPDTLDRFGLTALAEAAGMGGEKALSLLLKHKADPNFRMKDGATAMHHAAAAENPSIVKRLYEAGAEMNARDKNGLTPLDHAQKKGNKAVIAAVRKYMLEEEKIFVTSATHLSKPVAAPKTAKFSKPKPPEAIA